VTVALERPTSEQPALDGILDGKDVDAAKGALLAQPEWRNGMDGRASGAMLRLLVALREPVSYTHLDVYKRQRWAGGRRFRAGWSRWRD